MRTTLDIADDVLLAIKEKAQRDKRSLGAVVSELVREALLYGTKTRADEGRNQESFFGFEPRPRQGNVVVTNSLIDRIREAENL
jgi:hypothetical protein